MTGGSGGGGSAQAVANVIYSLGKYDIIVTKCQVVLCKILLLSNSTF